MASRVATAQPGSARGRTESGTTAEITGVWRLEAAKGAATMLPLVLGYVPFALLIGAAAGASPEPDAAWVGAPLIFAGSAHLSVIEQISHGSGWAAAVGAGLLINARLMVYSASMASLWRGTHLRHRLLAAAVVIDPLWLVVRQRQTQPGTTTQQRAFYAGAAVTLLAGWSSIISAGLVLGARPGVTAFLGVCTPLCLSALVLPQLLTTAGARCGVAAAGVAMLTASWPSGTGLLAAMVAGAAAGASWRPRVRS